MLPCFDSRLVYPWVFFAIGSTYDIDLRLTEVDVAHTQIQYSTASLAKESHEADGELVAKLNLRTEWIALAAGIHCGRQHRVVLTSELWLGHITASVCDHGAQYQDVTNHAIKFVRTLVDVLL